MYQEFERDTKYKIIYKQLLGNGARLLDSNDNYESDMIVFPRSKKAKQGVNQAVDGAGSVAGVASLGVSGTSTDFFLRMPRLLS